MIFSFTTQQLKEYEAIAKIAYDSKRAGGVGQKWGDNTDFKANRDGMVTEFAVDDYFEQPRLWSNQASYREPYDMIINGLKIDTKNSPGLAINKNQFEKHAGKVDAFLFCKLLEPLMGVEVLGWIGYEEVISKSELISLPGRPAYYKVREEALRDADCFLPSFHKPLADFI